MKRDIFFSLYKKELDTNHQLSQLEVDSLDFLLDVYEDKNSLFTLQQWAYIFATIFHETAGTMRPIKEAFWMSEEWRKKNLRYYPYYGMDFVHTTWESNFRKFSAVVGVDLVKYPERIQEPKIAMQILIYGFQNGTWTGKKLSDYINAKKCLYIKARWCINSTDKAELIATYATKFETIFKQSA